MAEGVSGQGPRGPPARARPARDRRSARVEQLVRAAASERLEGARGLLPGGSGLTPCGSISTARTSELAVDDEARALATARLAQIAARKAQGSGPQPPPLSRRRLPAPEPAPPGRASARQGAAPEADAAEGAEAPNARPGRKRGLAQARARDDRSRRDDPLALRASIRPARRAGGAARPAFPRRGSTSTRPPRARAGVVLSLSVQRRSPSASRSASHRNGPRQPGRLPSRRGSYQTKSGIPWNRTVDCRRSIVRSWPLAAPSSAAAKAVPRPRGCASADHYAGRMASLEPSADAPRPRLPKRRESRAASELLKRRTIRLRTTASRN